MRTAELVLTKEVIAVIGEETSKRLQRRANAFARSKRCGTATSIIVRAQSQKDNKLVSHTPSGHRKRTTGEYVPNAYLSNFGWKNTYYQHAETVVMIGADYHTVLKLAALDGVE